jgi:hypothetical protein
LKWNDIDNDVFQQLPKHIQLELERAMGKTRKKKKLTPSIHSFFGKK